MKIKFIWPGKTAHSSLKKIQDDYIKKISVMADCRLIQTREAKGISEKHETKIKEIEAEGLEKSLENDYLICLTNQGKEMNSEQLARFLDRTSMNYPYPMAFVVGGYLGIADRILERANFRLSLSKMTFSHELCRVILLEQIYRSLSILKGKKYAK